MANLEKQIPFDGETLLTVASIGKLFTSIGVLQLNERGQLDLYMDARPYFQPLSLRYEYDQPLNASHLLTHTDGFETRMIGVAVLNEQDLLPLENLLKQYQPRQLYPPGQYLTYGDYAANLGGYLIEQIGGQSFKEYMEQNIFKPLGMKDSTFNLRLNNEMRSRLATGYSYENGSYQPEIFVYVRYAPTGGLRTTGNEMAHFMLSLLDPQSDLLSARTRNDPLFERQFSQIEDMPGITYGLFEDFTSGRPVLIRDGDGLGMRSRVLFIPEENLGVFLHYNSGDSRLRLDLPADLISQFYPIEPKQTQPLKDHQA